MLLAYSGKKFVGYLGIFADKIYVNEAVSKAGWFSCMWIDEKQRGKGIAKKLLIEAFRYWNNKILVTEFTPAAKALYDSSNQFQDLIIKEGIRCYMRFNLYQLLPKKNTFFKAISPFLKFKDNALNFFNDLRLKIISSGHSLKDIHYETVNGIDVETEKFIEEFLPNQFCRRNAEDLRWMLNNPWILPNSKKDGTENKYHFSAFDVSFEFRCIKIFDKEKALQGFVIISIRGKNLKVPYFYAQSGYAKQTIKLLIKIMLDEKLNMLSVFHEELVSELKKSFHKFIFKKKIKRHYVISKVFSQDLKKNDNVILQDGDADCAFT
jgi:hypothetical protein